MKYFVFVLIFFMAHQVHAQNMGSVVVYKDVRADLLLKKQAEVNNLSTRSSTKRRTARGYRLLIISTNSKAEAIAARTKIYTNFPDLKPYMWHQSPYYKVKVGNFTGRKEAQDYQKRLGAFFPNGVFIINDIVEVNPDANGTEE